MCMSKRLQVLLDEDEFVKLQEFAHMRRLTVAAVVRDALRGAMDPASRPDTRRRLQVIEEAAAHQHPIADMDQLLAEIEHGYLDTGRP